MGTISIVVCAILTIGATMLFTRKTNDSKTFNVANRNIGAVAGAMSVAANWVWAPSLFVAAERAYLTGIPGMFWFLVPNVLCLILFIPFAKRIRKKMPDGITLSAYMGERYESKQVQGIYQFQLGGLAVLSASVQLLAGSKMVSLISGLPFFWVSVALAAIAFAYTQFSGIKASVTADIAKIVIVMAGIVILLPMLLNASGGVATLLNGLGGRSGNYNALFSDTGIEVLFAFGLPTAIGLTSGPFGDQSFWQRSFAIREKSIGRAFLFGALLFGIVPICMGAVGFIAAGAGFNAADSGVVNLEYITATLPQWVLIPFLLMVITGLLSVVGSNLCAVASLLTDKRTTSNVNAGRIGMAALLIAALGIANIPGLTVTHLFLLYGTLRASTLLPTMLTLSDKRLKANAVFAGILLSLCIGLPIFAYGNLVGSPLFKTIGSLLTVSISGIVSLAASRKGVQEV